MPPHSLIIGGTRGIGREVASRLASEGSRVSVLARNLPARKTRIPSVRYLSADVRDTPGVAAALKRAVRQSGRIDHVVFLQRYRGEGDNWLGEVETSLTATKNIVELVQDYFVEGGGAIVIISSVNSTLIAPYLPVGYHVAKAALVQMVRYWAVTLGPRGVRVNSVSPGTVLKEESKAFFLGNKDLAALYCRIIPLGRHGHASEVAGVVSFLCGANASFVTGQDIVVDGGVSLQWQESLAREIAGLSHQGTPKPVSSK